MTEEGERSDTVLGSGLKGSSLRVVLEEMVVGHVEAIAEKGKRTLSVLGTFRFLINL